MEQEKLVDKVCANLEEARADKPKVNKKNIKATVADIASVWQKNIDNCKHNITVLQADAKDEIERLERDSIDTVNALDKAYANIPDDLDTNAKRLEFVSEYQVSVDKAVKAADAIANKIVNVNNTLTADINAEEDKIKLYETHIENIKKLCSK